MPKATDTDVEVAAPSVVSVERGDYIVLKNGRWLKASVNDADMNMTAEVSTLARALEPFSYATADNGASYEQAKHVQIKQYWADAAKDQRVRTAEQAEAYLQNYAAGHVSRVVLQGNGLLNAMGSQALVTL